MHSYATMENIRVVAALRAPGERYITHSALIFGRVLRTGRVLPPVLGAVGAGRARRRCSALATPVDGSRDAGTRPGGVGTDGHVITSYGPDSSPRLWRHPQRLQAAVG